MLTNEVLVHTVVSSIFFFCKSASGYNELWRVLRESDHVWARWIWDHLQGQTFQLLRGDHLEIPGDQPKGSRLAGSQEHMDK